MSQQAPMPSVGFVGLGAMGSAMVRQIAAAGYTLTVFDADAARTAALAVELNCTEATSAADVARQSDVIITILPTSAIVEQVLFSDGGAYEALRKGTLVIEMSSGAPAQTVAMAKRLASLGGSLVDAPVSGGVSRARTGELAIMFGGDDTSFAAAEPVLRTMGKAITRTGDVGSGHAMKALNNLVSAAGFLIGVEALLIGSRFGLDPRMMVDVLNTSTGMNNSTQKKFKQFVLSRSFDAGFSLDLMAKDVSIAINLADETGTGAPFAALCRQMWVGAQRYLGPGHDHTAMAKFSEMIAGSALGEEDRQV